MFNSYEEMEKYCHTHNLECEALTDLQCAALISKWQEEFAFADIGGFHKKTGLTALYNLQCKGIKDVYLFNIEFQKIGYLVKSVNLADDWYKMFQYIVSVDFDFYLYCNPHDYNEFCFYERYT